MRTVRTVRTSCSQSSLRAFLGDFQEKRCALCALCALKIMVSPVFQPFARWPPPWRRCSSVKMGKPNGSLRRVLRRRLCTGTGPCYRPSAAWPAGPPGGGVRPLRPAERVRGEAHLVFAGPLERGVSPSRPTERVRGETEFVYAGPPGRVLHSAWNRERIGGRHRRPKTHGAAGGLEEPLVRVRTKTRTTGSEFVPPPPCGLRDGGVVRDVTRATEVRSRPCR